MAEYIFVPSGVRVQSPAELAPPLWAKAGDAGGAKAEEPRRPARKARAKADKREG